MASSGGSSPLVFTSHDGRMLCGVGTHAVYRIAFRWILRGSDAVVALSKSEAVALRRMSPGINVYTIPNGVPPEAYPLNADARTSTEPEILYVGQLIDIKGVDVLLRAFARLARRTSGRLTLVYQNAKLEERYRRLAQELGIRDRVTFAGFLSAADVSEKYRRAHLLVLPSFAEALPSVITEAFLSGTPVVATAVGGIPEQIGGFGVAVPPGDVDALAAAIEVRLSSLVTRAEAEVMGRYAREKFAVPAMIRAHMDLYHEVLSRRTAPIRRIRGTRLLRGTMRAVVSAYVAIRRKRGSLVAAAER
jgi:glycosyltransferase involved in cell wall biosynthesis